MSNDGKKYVYVNPTLLNKGGENSVQTVSRKVKEQLDSPIDAVDRVAEGLNWLWSTAFKSIPYFILVVVLPFTLCTALGGLLLHYVISPNPDVGYFVSGSFTFIVTVLGFIPEIIAIILPPALIIGCAVLCLALSTLMMASLVHPNNPRKRKQFFTAFFGAQLGLFVYGIYKKDNKR